MTTTPSAALAYAALTDVGRVRAHNEDALLCCAPLNLWAVADGMGGHQRGEVASALALQELRRQVRHGATLPAAIGAAHAAILTEAATEAGSQGMGTTLVAVRFSAADFQLAWVGDSRAYRIGAGRIEQLSRDHSWVQLMVDAGRLSSAEARQHPRRNQVTHCLGQTDGEPQIDSLSGQLEPGELLLLCSDGLSGELDDDEILRLCSTAPTLEALVATLVEAAREHGGRDNISCIVLGRPGQTEPSVAERPRGLLAKLFHSAKS